MKNKARVVVVGGGVVGVSTLYHLAKKGWKEVVLVEQADLTSGSTWHAAGLLPLFNMSYSVGQIHKYSVRLYGELEAETGLNPGLSRVGNIRLAMTEDRMDEYRQYSAVASTIGVRVDFFDSRGGAGALAALCDGRVGGGDCSSGGRLYSAGGFDFCAGEGGQESWGGDLYPDAGGRYRTEAWRVGGGGDG